MAGLFDFLFGSEPEAQPITQPLLHPEQEKLLSQYLAPYLRGEKEFPLGEGFPGSLNISPSNLETLSLAGFERLAMGEGSTTPAAGDFVKQTLARKPGELPADFDQFFEQAVATPLRTEFDRTRSQTTRRFAGAGFGSDRERADRELTDDFINRLSQARAGTALQLREGAENRSLQAAALAPDIEAGRGNVLAQALTAGGVPRSVQEGNLARTFDEFLRVRGDRDKRVNQILSALGLRTVDNSVVANPGRAGVVQQGAALATPFILSKFLR